jgi:plasmid replication initiation protein
MLYAQTGKERWFLDKEVIEITFEELINIFKKKSNNKYKDYFLKIVEGYRGYEL